METIQTEATCRLKVSEQKKNRDRPLTSDEMTEFVGDLADHLGDDERDCPCRLR